jgi:hypothetical protein
MFVRSTTLLHVVVVSRNLSLTESSMEIAAVSSASHIPVTCMPCGNDIIHPLQIACLVDDERCKSEVVVKPMKY